MRPLRVASASSGSGCDVKNCHGVDAPHSSPMNSMGVPGAVIVSTAATCRRAIDSVWLSRSPAARLPIWSWSCANSMNRHEGTPAGTGAPQFLPRNDDHVPSW